MKPAILVALLFRTLDAFRIFDNIYVMTGGANDTESVSILGYARPVQRGEPRPGLGGRRCWCSSSVAVIAFVFIKVLRDAICPARTRGDELMHGAQDATAGWTVVGVADRALRAVPGAVDLSLSLKPPGDASSDGSFLPNDVDLRQLQGHLQPATLFTSALINSIGIALIATVIAVVARRCSPPTRSPGWTSRARRLSCRRGAGDRDVPADLARRRRCSTCGADSASTTPGPGLIIPYMTFALPLAI